MGTPRPDATGTIEIWPGSVAVATMSSARTRSPSCTVTVPGTESARFRLIVCAVVRSIGGICVCKALPPASALSGGGGTGRGDVPGRHGPEPSERAPGCLGCGAVRARPAPVVDDQPDRAAVGDRFERPARSGTHVL